METKYIYNAEDQKQIDKLKADLAYYEEWLLEDLREKHTDQEVINNQFIASLQRTDHIQALVKFLTQATPIRVEVVSDGVESSINLEPDLWEAYVHDNSQISVIRKSNTEDRTWARWSENKIAIAIDRGKIISDRTWDKLIDVALDYADELNEKEACKAEEHPIE